MCGIVGFVGSVSASDFLLCGLEKLEYRGYDSAGISVLSDRNINTVKTVKRVEDLEKKIKGKKNFGGSLGIGHTRWATHGAATEINAHPHLSFDKKFAVVHNGIIENYAALKQKLKQKGVEFFTQTDTEVIPNLIMDFYDGNFLKAVESAVTQLVGSFAIGVICSDFPDTLICAKKSSPLILGLGQNENYIASDVNALMEKTRNVVYLKDDEIAVVKSNTVSLLGFDGKPRDINTEYVDWDISAAEKGGFDYFMMKEIFEQPQAVRKTLSAAIKNGKIDFADLKIDLERLKRTDKIFITACGSAYHAGVAGKYILEELLKIPVTVDIASEFRYRDPLVDDKTLVFVISQSGETADTLAALATAREKGGYVISVVNVVGSSIAKASDDVIYTSAGPEIAVATTKGYTTQLVVLYMIGIYLAGKLKTAGKKALLDLTNELLSLPDKLNLILSEYKISDNLITKCAKASSVFFIGRGTDYAASLEASLKLKEISYIHSEAYPAGELKHGTISLIENDKIVFALCCDNKLSDKMLSNIKEVRARGAFVISSVNEDNPEIEENSDVMIRLPTTNRLFVPLLECIPFQLISYAVAVSRGCDVDKPRNLAKSVTVE